MIQGLQFRNSMQNEKVPVNISKNVIVTIWPYFFCLQHTLVVFESEMQK